MILGGSTWALILNRIEDIMVYDGGVNRLGRDSKERSRYDKEKHGNLLWQLVQGLF